MIYLWILLAYLFSVIVAYRVGKWSWLATNYKDYVWTKGDRALIALMSTVGPIAIIVALFVWATEDDKPAKW